MNEAGGYKVEMHHLRLSEKDCATLVAEGARLKELGDAMLPVPVHGFLASAQEIKERGDRISSCGGYTSVLLLDGDREIAHGEAWCNPREVFSKKIGRDAALGRALKNVAVPA